MMALDAQIASVEAEYRRTKAELEYAREVGEKAKKIARLTADEKALRAYLLNLGESKAIMQGKLKKALDLYQGKYAAAFVMRYLQRGNTIEGISEATKIEVEELEKAFADIEREDLFTR